MGPKKQKVGGQPGLPVSTSGLLTHNNQRLFSDYFLDSVMTGTAWRERGEWQALLNEAAPVMTALQERYARFSVSASSANEAQTESDWIRLVLEALGHTFDRRAKLRLPGPTGAQRSAYIFYASQEQQRANRGRELGDRAAQYGALAIGDAKQWDVPLDQMRRGAGDSFSNKNPSFQLFFALLHSKLPWGILTNGRKWRLYHQASAYKLEVYYEVDLPDLLASEDVERFLYFYAFFRRAAFSVDHPLALNSMLAESTRLSEKTRDDLRDQVYDALTYVAQGFFAYPSNHLTPTAGMCQQVYENALILLYRFLFVLYAESRQLLPVKNSAYQQRYSLGAIKDQVRLAHKDRAVLLAHSGVIWSQLKTLFRSIDSGEALPGINTFDGGLFDPRKHDFLERYVAGDLDLSRAIDKLARTPRDEQDFSEDSFIDYRDLSERHLGTIYEGLLEYTLHVASEPMVELRSTSAIVPMKQAAACDVAASYQPGEVYLVTDTGQRKTTGSYYTPDYIVEYMVAQTLKPVLEQAVQGAQSDRERMQAILAIRVLDPAMGSGHFPVEVVEYIARYLIELGVLPEGKDPREADMLYWKRRVAQHCIYGVDANPLAVELAKLSLWLATAAKGSPLNFLDHHLRPGNALIGARFSDVATSEHPKVKLAKTRGISLLDAESESQDGEEGVQFSMLDDQEFSQDLGSALDMMGSIERVGGNTVQEVKQQEMAYAKLRERFTQRYQDVMNLGVAIFYTIEIPSRLWGACAAYAVKAPEEQQKAPGAQQYEQILQQARSLGERKRFFHWELEFPDIFFEHDGTPKGELTGFDAIVGNPPYVRQEKLSEDKPFYQDHYDIYHGAADLFVYFFGQGLRLLRSGGRLAYISSNSWLRAGYATPLRRFLRLQTSVEQIIDLGNTRVFTDAPDLSPAIQVVCNLSPTNGHLARAAIFSRTDTITAFRDNLDGRLFEVSMHDQPDEGWQLCSNTSRQLLSKIKARGKPLSEVINGRMYYGVKTGLNDAFIIDDTTRKRLIQADPASAQLIKPLVRGEDLRPWYQENEGRWLILAYRGMNIDAYPAVQAHLSQFRERLEPRPESGSKEPWPGRKAGSYRWYEIQDTVEYAPAFDGTKILYPDITRKPRFSWGEPAIYTSNTGYFIPAQTEELLGILNSRAMWFVITHISHPLAERKGALIYRLFSQYTERLPIPTLTDEQCAQIGGLAQQLTRVARERYRVRREVTQRVKSDLGAGQRKVTDRLDKWWQLDWQGFRDEVRKSFKREIPLKERSQWQESFEEQQAEINRFTAEIVRLEEALNATVYAVYSLNEEEIALVERETTYQYGEW